MNFGVLMEEMISTANIGSPSNYVGTNKRIKYRSKDGKCKRLFVRAIPKHNMPKHTNKQKRLSIIKHTTDWTKNRGLNG